ncbi:cytochrome P450 [Mycotypha africana]|uniref:cytochrome P450 n=1 Tax=Mycotypha africana TaxID=64632 RepID=UPI0023011E4B|nr:cytochrome P450 [Mycotypha africana]KAI8991007.1 cytochrome P450 [Mycotypha africana]
MIYKVLSYILSLATTFLISKVGQNVIWANKKADGTPKPPWPVSPQQLPFFTKGWTDYNNEGYHAFTRWSKQLGHLFSVKLGLKRIIVLNNAEWVHKVLIEKEQWNSSRMLSDSLEKTLTDNAKTIFTAPFSLYWSRLRRATYLVIGKWNAFQFQHLFQQEANRLSLGISSAMTMDSSNHSTTKNLTATELRHMVDLIAMNTALTIVMGKNNTNAMDPPPQHHDDPATMLTLLQKIKALEARQTQHLNRVGQFFPFINALLDVKNLFTLDSTNVNLRNEILEIFLPWFEPIYQQQEQEQEHPQQQKKQIDAIVKSLLHIEPSRNDPEPVQLKKDEALVNLVHMALHAYTYLSSSLFTLIQRLAASPDLQAKLREQGKAFAQALVHESLRYDPPQPLLAYAPRTDYDLDNVEDGHPTSAYRVDQDTEIIVNVHAIHRQSQYYTKPDTFSPERFLKQEKETAPLLQLPQEQKAAKSEHKKASDHLAFGAGRRACIASQLSTDFLATIVLHLVHSFELKGGNVHDKIECKTNIWSWIGRTETKGASIEFIKRE